MARILRIYPALIVAVSISVLVIGFGFTTLSVADYFQHADTYKYLLKNSSLIFGIEKFLPGSFDLNPYRHAVNGSLWTLPYEIGMYFILAATLVCAGYLSKRLRLLSSKNIILTVVLAAVLVYFLSYYSPRLRSDFLRLFTMFFLGSGFYFWRDKIWLSPKIFLFVLSLLMISTIQKSLFYCAYIVTLPYIVFYMAYVPSGKMRLFNRLGDYSYGIYIYAFPVQQSIVALMPDISIAQMVVFSFLVTLLLAVLSWHFIESRALRYKAAHLYFERGLAWLVQKCWPSADSRH